MKKSLAAGLIIFFILSACSRSITPEHGSIPTFTPPSSAEESAIPLFTTSPSNKAETPDPSASTPSPADLCQEEAGTVLPYEIPWKDELLTGRIYTPPCYGSEGERAYPALYMLHGATESDQQWDDLGLDEWADSLISGGDIPPLIIIMPREVTWIVLPENPFGDHLIKAVIPWVDANYRTLDDRAYRAIGGMSRGGNWAVRLGLLHWGLFGSIGAHSTPLFIGDLNRVPGWAEIIPAAKTPRILLDIGQDDNNLAEAERLHDALLDLGIAHDWRLYPGLHDEAYWRAHLEEYLKWYSEGWVE